MGFEILVQGRHFPLIPLSGVNLRWIKVILVPEYFLYCDIFTAVILLLKVSVVRTIWSPVQASYLASVPILSLLDLRSAALL